MKNLSVKVKLLATILLVSLVPLLVSGYLNYQSSYDGIYDLTVYDLNYITLVKANEVSQLIENRGISKEDLSDVHSVVMEIQEQYYKKHGLDGYGYIIDEAGTVIVHPSSGTVGQNLMQHQFAQDILKQKSGYLEYDWEGRMKVASFQPLTNGWFLVVGSYLEDMMQPTVKIKNQMFIVSIVAALLAFALGLFIVLQITRPIQRLVVEMKKAEEGDLTVQVPVTSNDEIGRQSAMFNEMMQQFRKMLGEVNNVSQNVAASSEQLTASANESAKASEQIAIAASEISQSSEQQMESVHRTSTHIHETSRALQSISDNVSKVNQDSNTATQYAHEGKRAMESMSNEMSDISNKVRSTEAVVRELGSYSDSISGIITTIREISEQTNLLALNAAIEAARAGEQGRSFAVVAQEVRKLAEQSSRSAEEIENLITRIRNEIGRAVTAMEESSNAVADGLVIVEGAGKSFTNILTAIEAVNKEVQLVAVSAEQISRDSKQVVEQADAISKLAEGSSADTEEVAAASEEQNATMEEITSASEVLAQMAEQLQGLVSRFKL